MATVAPAPGAGAVGTSQHRPAAVEQRGIEGRIETALLLGAGPRDHDQIGQASKSQHLVGLAANQVAEADREGAGHTNGVGLDHIEAGRHAVPLVEFAGPIPALFRLGAPALDELLDRGARHALSNHGNRTLGLDFDVQQFNAGREAPAEIQCRGHGGLAAGAAIDDRQ